MGSLQVCLNAAVPLFIYLAAGYLARCLGLILVRVLKNPLIIATALGPLWLGFDPRLPRFMETAITQMSAVAVPIMWFLLGPFDPRCCRMPA